MADNRINGLRLEIDIVDSEFVVEPFYLLLDEGLWNPGTGLDFPLD